jgi:hypothetical protein
VLVDERAAGARAHPEGRGRAARPREVPDIDLRGHRRSRAARSRRSATPSSCRTSTRTCSSSTSCAPQGHPALRPARLRQDDDRQGRRQLAGQRCEKDRRSDVKSYFLNIKGPELLNKYVGETERQIRLIFQRAREKAARAPVIVFFDEMDSLFRTRGSGVSSDVETTIVPQLLAEIDGVETPQGRRRHRRLEPRGHDRPGDPAARPARREDQDRAPRRRGRPRDLRHLPHAGCRCTRTTSPSTAATARRPSRTADPARRRRCTPRTEDNRVPRGHLRQRGQGGPVLQGLQLRRDDRERRRPGQEARDQAVPRRPARRA